MRRVRYDVEVEGWSRVTIEDDAYHEGWYEITCGIYGALVHTVFASSYGEAIEKAHGLQRDLEEFIRRYGEEGFDSTGWIEAFVDRWV